MGDSGEDRVDQYVPMARVRTALEARWGLHPLALNRVFAQAIYNHLRHSSQVVERRHAQIFIVVPMLPGADSNEVAKGLVRAFAKVGRAHHVSPEAERTLDPNTTVGWQGRDRYDELEEQFDFLIYEADGSSTSWTRRAFRQADQVIFVAESNGSEKVGELEQKKPQLSTKEIIHMVDIARLIQKERFTGTKLHRNAEMSNVDIDNFAKISDEARKIAITSTERLHLSTRVYYRILRVARTIADIG